MTTAPKKDFEIERKTRAIAAQVYGGKTVILRDAASGGQIAFFTNNNTAKIRPILSENCRRDCVATVRNESEPGEYPCPDFGTPTEHAEVSVPAAPASIPAPVEAAADVPAIGAEETVPAVEPVAADNQIRDDDVVVDAADGDDDAVDEAETATAANPNLKEARHKAKMECLAALREFNDRYMVVNDGGAAIIFFDDIDHALGRRVYRRMTPGALKTLYLNRTVCTRITDDGQRAKKCVADFWLKHENRRQFIDGVTFDPSNSKKNPNVLNLWNGFAVEPKPGSWGLLKWHILTVLCRSDKSHFDYFMGWMARLIQYPAKQGEVAVVLRGNVGTGKGTVGHALLSLFNQHGMHISSSKHLVGSFNAHLRDCVFLFADEAFFAGDKANLGTLKALVTEPILTIEAKYANAIQCRNMLHVFMCSNSDWVVPATRDERRFFVLDVSDEHKQEKPYFAAIKKELEHGGHAAMLHELLHYDLSNFNVRDVPETQALQDQKKHSLDTTHAWWTEVLMRAYVFRSKLGLEGHFGEWHEFVTTDVLFDSYRDFAKGERHPMSREQIGKFLTGLKYKSGKPAHQVVGEHMAPHGAELIYNRKPGFYLGALDDARQAFEKITGLSSEWDID